MINLIVLLLAAPLLTQELKPGKYEMRYYGQVVLINLSPNSTFGMEFDSVDKEYHVGYWHWDKISRTLSMYNKTNKLFHTILLNNRLEDVTIIDHDDNPHVRRLRRIK